MEERDRHPDTTSVGLGHDASEHLGALKPPIYETSTFVFSNAEEGKRFFAQAYGEGERLDGYIYSRLDSPNLAAAEERLARWEGTEDAAVFGAGMAAISTLFLTFLRPGDVVLYSSPTYGGTSTLLKGLLGEFGVESRPFDSSATESDLRAMVDDGLAMVYVETPANPTNDLFDIAMAARVAAGHEALVVVDNTFLSPVWQRPKEHGADLIVHSATKYLGGHSDLTAGAVCGSSEHVSELRQARYEIGTTPSPSTAWLLARSIETLRLRVEQQTANATTIAHFLAEHPKITRVSHLSQLQPGDPGYDVFKRQCLGPGAMVTFEIDGGEAESFRFLDAMEVVKLATSLGGSESLASHPWTMSPPTVPEQAKRSIGVTPGLIRLSVGLENVDDLVSDLGTALSAV